MMEQYKVSENVNGGLICTASVMAHQIAISQSKPGLNNRF